MSSPPRDIRKREETFTSRTVTRIWQEVPTPENPYLAETCRCHGYDLLDLAAHRGFIEVLFLLFRGELPTTDQARILETLFVGLINPGPRHPSVRAAMNAGVSRTQTHHLLPIGLAVLGGDHLGGGEVLAAMRFIDVNLARPAAEVATESLTHPRPVEGDFHPVPGFGSRFGSIDPMPGQLAHLLHALPGSGTAMAWGAALAAELTTAGLGWLTPGVAAAALHDLGFSPWAGAGLFQLACAPGVLAHGLELADKPITAMPFLDKDHYVISPDGKR